MAVLVAAAASPGPAAEPAATEVPPVAAEKKAPPQIEAASLQELRGRVGETIVVTGEVDRVGKSSGGHRFLSFSGNGELTVFIASDVVPKFKGGTPETLFAGKTVAVRGTLERFRGKLQIPVRSPEMITLVEKKRGPPDGERREAGRPEPVELKPDGRDAWISPAGLRYAGRDPQGLTRKEHVVRHARDLPDRDGPHGVFDGGEDLAFAWIDAAWKKIERDKLKPVLEGDRVTYTVSMGRRVGYLGGRTGADRGHPPLSRIFLVLRKGTTEVVTAFPR